MLKFTQITNKNTHIDYLYELFIENFQSISPMSKFNEMFIRFIYSVLLFSYSKETPIEKMSKIGLEKFRRKKIRVDSV